MIVITGAAGHIGNVLIRELLRKGRKNIRALVLPEEDLASLESLDVEIVQGNILKPYSLDQAFAGADLVFHLAAMISISPGTERLMHEINVTGTKNVINACLKNKVKRLVYTSSIHAVEEPPKGTVITEKFPFKPAEKKMGYDRTKAEATIEVLNAVKKGLGAVVVCPTGVIGPYDFRLSEMGSLFVAYTKKIIKVYLNAAYDYVDVRDAAAGHILAAEKGKTGETYILSGEKVTIKRIFKILEETTGVKRPRLKMPMWMAKASTIFTPLWYKLRKEKPLFTRYSIHTLCTNCDISSNKAKRELGFSPRPIEESIKDSVNWLKEKGLIK